MAVGMGRLKGVEPGLPNKGLHPGEAALLGERTAFPLCSIGVWRILLVSLDLFLVLGWRLRPKEKPTHVRDSCSQL